jgi:hypothetical protein
VGSIRLIAPGLIRAVAIIAGAELVVGAVGTLVMRAGLLGFVNITFFAAIALTLLALIPVFANGPLVYELLGATSGTNVQQDIYVREAILADDTGALRRDTERAGRAVPLVVLAVIGGLAAVLIAEAALLLAA